MSDTAAPSQASTPVAWFAGLSGALSAVRAPFCMSMLTIVALWLPEQVREIYRVLVQRGSDTGGANLQWQWVLAAGSLVLLSLVLWQVTRELTHAASAGQDMDREPIAKLVLDW